jgi:hypothetical protein
MKYNFYISVWTPVQHFGLYYKGDKHPLEPSVYRAYQKSIATKMSLLNPEASIPPEAVVFLFLYELPGEVIEKCT